MLIVVAVLLTIVQALNPVPGKAPNSPTSTSQGIQKNADSSHNPAANSPSAVNPVQPNQNEKSGSSPQGKDAQQSVRITEFPGVSVSRDWADWMLWVFSGLLVLAAFLGIHVANRTLKITERAARAAKLTAQTTKTNLDSFIESERAWLLGDNIGKIQDTFDPDQNRMGFLWIRVPITNFGRSIARIKKTSIRTFVVPRPKTSLPSEPDYTDIRDADSPLPPQASMFLIVGINKTDWIAVKAIELTLYVYGFVDYLDLGNIERRSRFCYTYHIPGGFNPDPEGFYPCGNCPEPYTKCN